MMSSMADDNKASWLNYLALTTVIVAVCATLATFKGGGYSTRQVLSQARASDQWAYYQAKSVKSDLYQLAREQAESDPKRAADYAARVARYDQEKAKIMADAKALEEVRDEAQKHGGLFGIAVIFLQISILLSSIAALLKHKQVWLLGLVVGAGGIFYFLKGFFLFL